MSDSEGWVQVPSEYVPQGPPEAPWHPHSSFGKLYSRYSIEALAARGYVLNSPYLLMCVGGGWEEGVEGRVSCSLLQGGVEGTLRGACWLVVEVGFRLPFGAVCTPQSHSPCPRGSSSVLHPSLESFPSFPTFRSSSLSLRSRHGDTNLGKRSGRDMAGEEGVFLSINQGQEYWLLFPVLP